MDHSYLKALSKTMELIDENKDHFDNENEYIQVCNFLKFLYSLKNDNGYTIYDAITDSDDSDDSDEENFDSYNAEADHIPYMEKRFYELFSEIEKLKTPDFWYTQSTKNHIAHLAYMSKQHFDFIKRNPDYTNTPYIYFKKILPSRSHYIKYICDVLHHNVPYELLFEYFSDIIPNDGNINVSHYDYIRECIATNFDRFFIIKNDPIKYSPTNNMLLPYHVNPNSSIFITTLIFH